MKHMKLLLLLASIIMLQPVCAGNKMDCAKKTAKVVGHTLTMLGGMVLFCETNFDWMQFFCKGYKSKSASFCNKLRTGIHKGFKGTGTNMNLGIAIMIAANSVGPGCIYSGISGLNRELKLAERIKKFADKLKNKSKKVVNKEEVSSN